MTRLRNLIEERLSSLVGLPLSIARRGADMAIFHFGRIRKVDRGTVGDCALHVQCAWRVEGPEGIVTGRTDLWRPSDAVSERPGFDIKKWNYEDGNLRDERIREWLGGYDPETRSPVSETGNLVVTAVSGDSFGGAAIELSGGYRLVIWPAGIEGEMWRLFAPDDDEHFVVE